MIWVDTGPLVALCSPADNLHDRALRELDRLPDVELWVCSPVLCEAYYLLRTEPERLRLNALFDEELVAPRGAHDESRVVSGSRAWLRKYRDHEPDFADAYLIGLLVENRRHRVWTFDREFRSIWRLPNGNRPALA
jgi:predicted nucleic acid-binding protein